MDDRFLSQMRRDPPPELREGLRARLRAQGPATRLSALRPAPVLAVAFAAALVASLFAFPSMRASAQAMLDLFRVRKFAAVRFDGSRMDKLRELDKDHAFMVFDQKQEIHDPGPPRYVPTPEAASALAGIAVERPGYLPNGMTLDSVFVTGPGDAKMSVSEEKLRALLDALDLRDVSVPAGLNGKMVEMRHDPIVIQRYKSSRSDAALIQAKSPELSVPAGMDIPRLAEIGLRVLGLDAGEARRIAQDTDWRSTVLVPVPINASTFRQVTVHGQGGLLITTTAETSSDGQHHRPRAVVLWTENERVYAITGNLDGEDALQMAESVR
ncbi:MAG TPA: hypothetical protein VMJ70_15005 [Candidatus Sulfotelmatobacter sp.]|nr:hypothetical protein [Candidatus Sulfotelmatobacter sp.]